jgi:hypothetical protein
VEQLSGKPAELGPALPEGWGSWWTGGCSCLMPGSCLSQQGGAPVIPHGSAAQHDLMGGGSPRGGGPVIPHIAGPQQGLKGGGLGDGYPAELWDQLQAGVQCGWVVGILVVVDPAALLRG